MRENLCLAPVNPMGFNTARNSEIKRAGDPFTPLSTYKQTDNQCVGRVVSALDINKKIE